MRLLVGIGIILAALCMSAAAQTFDFTATEFRSTFDKQLAKDGGDPTKSCKKEGEESVCTFTDRSFQQSVKGFKALNLANGSFKLDAKMLISTEKNGKVSMIILGGDRGDPMNLMHFVGQVGSLLHTLNPALTDDEWVKMVAQLGLMRGDDDPSIGTPKMIIEPFTEVRCNSQHSKKSTAIGCVSRPRF